MNNPQKQGREVKKRLLIVVFTIIILTFTALLAFLPSIFGLHPKPAPVSATTPTATAMTPPAATPAVPAAKNPSPATKTTNMGRPAQLVEDLKAAGLDIVSDKFDHPELLPKAYRQGDCPSSRFLYNCRLDFDEKFKKLDGFYLFTKPPTSEWYDAPRLQLGAMNEMFTDGRARAKARYGEDYVTEIPDRTFAYAIWVKGSPNIWIITFDAWGADVGEIIGSRAGNVLQAQMSDITKPDKARLSGMETLYSDLMQAGLELGEPSSKPKVILSGYVDSSPGIYPVASYEYRGFKNAYVWTERKTDSIKEFELHSLFGPQTGWDGFVANINTTFSRQPTFPAGVLGETLSKGATAVSQRYGPASIGVTYPKGVTKNLSQYRFILDRGEELQYLSLRFIFYRNGAYSLHGVSVVDNIFVYTPPPPAKSK